MSNKSFSQIPGNVMGLVSLIGIITIPPAGLVCGIIGMKQAKAAKRENVMALVGTIINAILTALGIILITLTIFGFIGITNKAKDAQDILNEQYRQGQNLVNDINNIQNSSQQQVQDAQQQAQDILNRLQDQ